jgi:diguanylate cyclase (GGDEF)-like protein
VQIGLPSAAAAGVRPVRLTPALVVGVALTAWPVLWLAGALLHRWTAPVLGWLPLPVSALLAAWLCWRTARIDALPAAARRFWRSLALSMLLLVVGAVLHMVDAIGGPDAPTARPRMSTLAVYVAAVLVTQWALLRLPSGTGFAGGWLRLLLDSGAVVVTASVFIWHFSFRRLEQWTEVTGSVWPLLTVVVLAFVAMIAFVKVVSVGAGPLDPGALRVLAVATAGSAVAGSLSPLLIAHPYITNAHLAVPIASIAIMLAADRQRRAAGVAAKPAAPRRRWNAVPYTAVAATNALLLIDGGGPDGRLLALGAVTLTSIVVIRQLAAFAENSRLLDRVDRSVTALRDAGDQLVHQANHDELTQLANRGLMQDWVRDALDRHDRAAVHLALIDLDDFKAVNDRLGHHVGDALLVAVAERLAAVGCATSVMARLGGDEFAILFAPAGRAEVDAAVRRIAGALQRPIRAGGHDLLIHASVGVADGTDVHAPRELLRRADVAMYAAKDRGKRGFFRYHPELDRHASEDARLGADLRRALDRGQLTLVYQPIVTLPLGTIVGVEALIRWRHPERGLVPPDVFIPVAERTGLIVPLGAWILLEACRQAVRWQIERPDEIRKMSVNVSARQLREPDFAASVAATLAQTGLPAVRLVIEVTETAVFDGGAALDSVHALHRLGVAVALDDFGTGHSSLGLLRTCPVDILKVDKSFVDEITTDSDQAVIATALIHIAAGLHLEAVAEGVETADQAARLHRLGYRFAQGYHFARPMPPDQLTKLLPALSPLIA